jgi:hypothetical protein
MSKAKVVFLLICFVLVTSFPVFTSGPQLISDLETGDNWIPAFDLKITKAQCTRFYMIISTCEVQYKDDRQDAKFDSTLRYIAFSSWGGEKTIIVRSGVHPTVVSILQGVRDIRSRIYATLFMMALSVFGLFFLLLGIFGKARLGGEPRLQKDSPDRQCAAALAEPIDALVQSRKAFENGDFRPFAANAPKTFGRRR